MRGKRSIVYLNIGCESGYHFRSDMLFIHSRAMRIPRLRNYKLDVVVIPESRSKQNIAFPQDPSARKGESRKRKERRKKMFL